MSDGRPCSGVSRSSEGDLVVTGHCSSGVPSAFGTRPKAADWVWEVPETLRAPTAPEEAVSAVISVPAVPQAWGPSQLRAESQIRWKFL